MKKILPNHKKLAFTLAEVLITLGIIGVVAALTIPTLVASYQKQATITKIQKFYSNMHQAIKLSEIDNGSTNTWTYPSAHNGGQTYTWLTTYITPYLKFDKINTYATSSSVYFNDGTIVNFGVGAILDISLYTDHKTSVPGKNLFYFSIYPDATSNAFRPYEWNFSGTGREKWTTGSNACTQSGDKKYCAGLIMYDGWKIASDYPW